MKGRNADVFGGLVAVCSSRTGTAFALLCVVFMSAAMAPVLHAQVVDSVTVFVTVGSPDTDDDGTPDDWELLLFTNLTTVTATSDFDGDGFLDRQEYDLGTDPKDPLSRLEISEVIITPSGMVRIIWQSTTNLVPQLRTYDLFCATSVDALATGGTLLQLSIPSEGAATDTDVPPPPGGQFYRITLHD